MHSLTPAEQQYIELHAQFFEGMGLPRIGGRMAALFLVAEEPLSIDEIAGKLKVSKASVSTNLRSFELQRFVVRVTRIGERKTLYQWSDQVWEQRVELARTLTPALSALAVQGLAAIEPGNTMARRRLELALEFTTFFGAYVERMLNEWSAHRASLPGGRR